MGNTSSTPTGSKEIGMRDCTSESWAAGIGWTCCCSFCCCCMCLLMVLLVMMFGSLAQ